MWFRWVLVILAFFKRSDLERKVDTLMARTQEFQDLIDGFNQATNDLAARIQKLEDQQAAGGMTAEDEKAAAAELSAIKDRLKALAADPDNPIPPTQP